MKLVSVNFTDLILHQVDRNLAILEPKWIEAVCGSVLSSRVPSGALLLTNHKGP